MESPYGFSVVGCSGDALIPAAGRAATLQTALTKGSNGSRERLWVVLPGTAAPR